MRANLGCNVVSAAIDPRVGLCSICRMAQRVTSARGSIFFLCRRSEQDARFVRYPRLPVADCRGFDNEMPPA